MPGPGSYNPSDYDGVQYLLSNFKTYGTRKYMKDSYSGSKRLSLVNTMLKHLVQEPILLLVILVTLSSIEPLLNNLQDLQPRRELK